MNSHHSTIPIVSPDAAENGNPIGRSRQDYLAAAVICLLVVAAFWNGLLDPLRTLQEDIATEMQGLHAVANEQIRQGQFPQWNHYIFAGTRLFADIHLALFYPGSVLFRVLPFPYAVLITWIVHYAGTALATYAFARVVLRIGPPAAAFAGLAFSLGGFCLGHCNHLNFVFAYPWWPLLLLATHEMHRHRGRTTVWYWLLGLFCMCCLILSGGTPVLMLALLALGWLAAILLLRDLLHGDFFSALRLATLLAVMGLCAICLTAFQLLPTMDLYACSARVDWNQQKRLERVLPWRTLLYQMFAPGTLGSLRSTFWGRVNHETLFFIGGVSIPFAALAITRIRRCIWVPLLLILLGLSITLAVGYMPLLKVMDNLIVGVKLRLPCRYIGLIQFSLVCLAAVGIHEWLQQREQKRLTFLGIAGLLTTAGMAFCTLWMLHWVRGPAESTQAFWAWYGQQPESIRPWLSGSSAITFANVTLNRSPLLTTFMVVCCLAGGIVFLASLLRNRRPVWAALLLLVWAAVEFALFGTSTWAGQQRFPALATAPGAPLEFLQKNLGRERYTNAARFWPLWRNRGSIYGLPLVDGYAGSEMNISREHINLVRRFELTSFEAERRRKEYPMAVLNLFSCRYLVTGENSKPLSLPSVMHGDGIIMYENPDRMPLAAFLPEVRVAPDLDATLAIMDAPDFDPRKFGIVNDATAWPAGKSPPPGEGESCDIQRWEAGDIAIQANSTMPRLMFVGVSYDKGWQVTVNDKPVAPIRLNACFNAIPVPAGQNLIRMEYKTPDLKTGLYMTLITFLALGSATAYALYKTSRLRSETSVT